MREKSFSTSVEARSQRGGALPIDEIPKLIARQLGHGASIEAQRESSLAVRADHDAADAQQLLTIRQLERDPGFLAPLGRLGGEQKHAALRDVPRGQEHLAVLILVARLEAYGGAGVDASIRRPPPA